uniref:Uncharacterized protein n=1 Tax=Moniliophthora roreri TaxID=221103 RepID=A0A0W0GAY1_MONRR
MIESLVYNHDFGAFEYLELSGVFVMSSSSVVLDSVHVPIQATVYTSVDPIHGHFEEKKGSENIPRSQRVRFMNSSCQIISVMRSSLAAAGRRFGDGVILHHSSIMEQNSGP